MPPPPESQSSLDAPEPAGGNDPARDRGTIDLGGGASVHASNLEYSFSRSSGPGGQNVNKLNTKAELRVAVEAIDGLDAAAQSRLRRKAGSRLTQEDEILVTCDEHRSQKRNREGALERLKELVTEAAKRPPVRKKKRLSRAQKQKRLEQKRKRAEKKSRRQWKPE